MVGGAQTLRDAAAYCNNDVRRLEYFVDELVDDKTCSSSASIPRTRLPTRNPRGSCARLTSSRCTVTPSTTRPSGLVGRCVQRPRLQQTGEADQENLQGRAALPSEVHLMSMAFKESNLPRWGGCVAYGPPIDFGLPIEVPKAGRWSSPILPQPCTITPVLVWSAMQAIPSST